MNLIIDKISQLLDKKKSLVVAFDGRCASGKTTLADNISQHFLSNVIHMDDFFLRPSQRTAERLDTPGGNFDRERFTEEVIIPLVKGGGFSYRPFVCSTMTLGDEMFVSPKPLTIIEGSYSCHPELFDFYDLHIFCDIDENTQYERLFLRNPDKLSDFVNKWIPMEEKYFECFDIKNKCDIIHNGRNKQ